MNVVTEKAISKKQNRKRVLEFKRGQNEGYSITLHARMPKLALSLEETRPRGLTPFAPCWRRCG